MRRLQPRQCFSQGPECVQDCFGVSAPNVRVGWETARQKCCLLLSHRINARLQDQPGQQFLRLVSFRNSHADESVVQIEKRQPTPRPRCRWTRYSITPTRCLQGCLSEHPRARFRRIRSLNWCVSQPGDIPRSTCVAAGQRRPGQRSVLDKIFTAKSLPPQRFRGVKIEWQLQ